MTEKGKLEAIAEHYGQNMRERLDRLIELDHSLFLAGLSMPLDNTSIVQLTEWVKSREVA